LSERIIPPHGWLTSDFIRYNNDKCKLSRYAHNVYVILSSFGFFRETFYYVCILQHQDLNLLVIKEMANHISNICTVIGINVECDRNDDVCSNTHNSFKVIALTINN